MNTHISLSNPDFPGIFSNIFRTAVFQDFPESVILCYDLIPTFSSILIFFTAIYTPLDLAANSDTFDQKFNDSVAAAW